MNLSDISKLLFNKAKTGDKHTYGVITAINGDNTYNVDLGNGKSVKCAKLTGAKVGDTVMVTILENGHATVTGRIGGDTDASDAQQTADDAIEAYKTVVLTGGNVTVNAGDTGTTTVADEDDDIPAGYDIIGILAVINVIGHNSHVAITDWRVNVDNTITVNFVNTGSSTENVQYAAIVLVTNL